MVKKLLNVLGDILCALTIHKYVKGKHRCVRCGMSKDPVKHCKLAKEHMCSHADGFLCPCELMES